MSDHDELGARDMAADNMQRERPYGRLLRPPERCKIPTIRALRRPASHSGSRDTLSSRDGAPRS